MPSARPTRLPRLATALLSLALASACASYEAAPIDLERVPREFAARRLADSGLRQFVAAFLATPEADLPTDALDLRQLQAIALFHRPELRLARARLRQAEAAHELAGELPNPRLAVGPGIVANPGDATRWLAGIGLTFPLDLSGQRSAAAELVASEVAAARLAVAREDQAIRAEVVQRAFELELQQQLRSQAWFMAVGRRQLADLVARRVAAGAAAAAEASAAHAAALRAELTEVGAGREAASALAALASALGLPVAALDHYRFDLPTTDALPVELGDLQQLAADAAARRLDVAAAICEYARSEAGLRLEVARQWPEFELGPGYEYDQGLHKFRLDLGFTLPLFHGNGAAMEQAKAARATAAAAVEAVQVRAITEIAAAQQQLADCRRALAAAQALSKATAAAMDLATSRVAAGADDAGVELEARIDHVDAEMLLAHQRFAARAAWLQLELALQQPVGPGLLAWQHAVPEMKP